MDKNEKLVELLKDFFGSIYPEFVLKSLAEHLVAHGVTVQEWISVKDRLPGKEDLELSQFHNFLVANEFGEVREAVFTGKYFAKLGSRLSGVTHWMHLPNRRKENEDEQSRTQRAT